MEIGYSIIGYGGEVRKNMRNGNYFLPLRDF